jgi:hypothetical protein
MMQTNLFTPTAQLIRLDRPHDLAHPCHSNFAVIGSSTTLHAARLTCADCGRFRGWLSHTAAAAIQEVQARVGSIPARDITLTKVAAMADQQTDNTGALFRNPRKEEGDNRPHYTGQLCANGRPMWVSGWIRKAKTGKSFMSLALRPKTEEE